jgi:hypothetical protein
MYVTAIELRGFRDLPAWSAEGLDRTVHLRGPTPATTAVGDALDLAFGALSPEGLDRALRRWGVVAPEDAPEVEGAPLPTEATWSDAEAARALVADGERTLRVELELALDPPLFAQLRELAAREPRVGPALARRPRLRLAVGALFAATWDAVAISIQRFSVGDEDFPVSGADRPRWLDRFLQAMATRLHRLDLEDDMGARLLDAATSRQRHDAYQRWTTALLPDGPRLRVARGPGEQPLLLGDELPLRRHGQAGLDRAALAGAVFLTGADVLFAEGDDPLLDRAVDGEDSPLEQVWRVGPRGALEVRASADPPPPGAPPRIGRLRPAERPE